MNITDAESSWIKIFGVLGFLVASFFLLQPLLPGSNESLADPGVLKQLMAGNMVAQPKEQSVGEFHGSKVTPPKLATLNEPLDILGSASEDKHIEVDLTHQRLYAFEGNNKVYEFPVSTGKWGRTPTGEFRIWTKIKSTLMHGGSGSDYYYLPNVPWVMFFGNNQVPASMGFSLHGTYWHNNFGHPMSHGCVNMRTEDAKVLFEWADPPFTNPKAWATAANAASPGTKILIYGDTPNE